MEIDANWLESVLRRKSYEESPVKVVDFKHDGGLAKGDNFLSKINKIKAKVLLGSGKYKTVSFFVKNQHDSEHLKKMSVDTGIFFREITASISIREPQLIYKYLTNKQNSSVYCIEILAFSKGLKQILNNTIILVTRYLIILTLSN